MQRDSSAVAIKVFSCDIQQLPLENKLLGLHVVGFGQSDFNGKHHASHNPLQKELCGLGMQLLDLLACVH